MCMCSACKINNEQDARGLQCNKCESWFHLDCLFLKDAEYSRICKSGNIWTCMGCAEVNTNESKITWCELTGLSNITQIVRGCYQEIVKRKKNIFILPRGRSGTDFINELTCLTYLFIDDTSWKSLGLPLVHIFVPIMLQKPYARSKAENNAMRLAIRLEKWAKGNIKGLMDESREIQSRLQTITPRNSESLLIQFSRLMLLGQVGKAVKLINNNSDIKGVGT